MWAKISNVLVLVILVSGASLAQIDWQTTVNLESDGVALQLAFGGSENATDGYDDGLDVLAPPPPPEGFYA